MHFTRRDWMRLTALGLAGHSLSGWLPALAQDSQNVPGRKRSCILLWMPGGPSQTDTFDTKPDHANGGEFKSIDTSVSGIRICEHLPRLAKQMEHVAIIPSMQTKEGDHQRAAYHLRTGYRPTGPVQYPTLGSLVSNELARGDLDLPGFVSILPPPAFGRVAYGPGFLGPSRAPLIVGGDNAPPAMSNATTFGAPLSVRDITLPSHVDVAEADSRLEILRGMEERFSGTRTGLATNSHREAYRQAVQMMRSPAIKAFNLEEEPEPLRTRYGRHRFGQACLLARRLVEQGVPFVEIALNSIEGQQVFGWDTHANNFPTVKAFCEVMDPAWATLIDDLKQRGLLESTMVIWMGEFGRTPRLNGSGRDHYPNAWSTVLCGGGIRGGQMYGRTSKDGMAVEDKPVSVSQLLATVCGAMGIDHRKQNMSNVGRPIRIVEPEAEPIGDLLA